MKEMSESLKEIFRKHRGLFCLMALLVMLGTVLTIFSLVAIGGANNATMKVGYSDIGGYSSGEVLDVRSTGGYRDGSKVEMLAFVVMAVILGFVHTALALVIYKMRGVNASGSFVVMSIVLVLGTWLTLLRLLGEG